MKKQLISLLLFTSCSLSANTNPQATEVLYQQCQQNSQICKIVIQAYIHGLNAGIKHTGLITAQQIFTEAGINNPELPKMAIQLAKPSVLGGQLSCNLPLNYPNVRTAILNQIKHNKVNPNHSTGENIYQAIKAENQTRCSKNNS